MTIRFTRSACDLYTRVLVSPKLKYLTPLYRLPKFFGLLDDVGLFVLEARAFWLECSISNTLTSLSPAHVTKVASFEWGMNLTEKIFSVWPVDRVVVRANCDTEDSGWYEWMFRC